MLIQPRFFSIFLVALCSAGILYTTPALAIDEALALQVSRPGDVEMTCGQLSQEAVLMRDIISTTEEIQNDNTLKQHGITAAGAVGSFFIGTVTGGVGLAAAGFLLKDVAKDEADKAEGVQDIAQQRRSFMVGIYNAKGCLGPMEHAMYDKNAPGPVEAIAHDLASIQPAAGNNTHNTRTYNQ